MQIITINLPEKYLEAIQLIVERTNISSRSDCLRRALHEFLVEDYKFKTKLDHLELVLRGIKK